ncbi:dihydropyrimidinase [Anaerococcus sp. Marseille-P3915]|uniref:dihydropyrimidinase n=1 Tax=Anaerococcus sp. Marseille-P3915 TaxID=2057799 RepID=UPI000D0AEF17|nr:dihydropyrimidinase [Anaerococcus sp. Marseille-P3915]
MSILLKNAKIIGEDDFLIRDIYIEDEKISEISENIERYADSTIDCKERLTMPGGVDVHTHLSLDLGKFISIDDFYTGTRAASFGGTTSIVDHIAFGPRGSLVSDEIKKYHKMAEGNAVIDYSFHGAIQEVTDDILDEIEKLFDEGIVSTKIYTTYGGMLDDKHMLRVLQKAKETGTVVCVHCENDGMIADLREEAKNKGNLAPIYHAKTRPAEAEAEAINRLIYLSEVAGFPKLYIVHTSSALGLREIRKARARGVKNLYCETCTQYLTLTDEKYLEGGESQGVKYICAPPLRKKSDVDALWEGIIDGTVDVIATDHCPFFYESEKLPYKDDFLNAPGGIPGIEERMEVVLTEGLKRGVSPQRLRDLLCTNPAKIFGLGYKKGSLEVGKDADIVVFDQEKYTISQTNRHSNCDYTTYEGFESDFKVKMVLSRGEVILENSEYKAEKGRGKFIKRKF